MPRGSSLHRIAVGSLTAAGALIALAAAPVGISASAGTDGTGPADDSADAPVIVRSGPAPSTPGSARADGDTPPGTAPDQAVFERQIDMMLRLVPQDEIEAFYNQQNVEYERRIADCMIEAGFSTRRRTTAVSRSPVRTRSGRSSGASACTPRWTRRTTRGWIKPSGDPNAEYLESLSGRSRPPSGHSRALLREHRVERRQQRDVVELRLQRDAGLLGRHRERAQARAANRAWPGCMGTPAIPSRRRTNQREWFSEQQWEKQNRFYESQAWLETSPDHDSGSGSSTRRSRRRRPAGVQPADQRGA